MASLDKKELFYRNGLRPSSKKIFKELNSQIIMESKIWFNGKLVNWEDAKIHVLTHSLHYGSGVFEGIRFYKTPNGRGIFRLKEHVDRLFYSASALKMSLPHTKEEIMKAIEEVVKTVNEDEGYIRPLVFYGNKMGLNPKGCEVNVIIAAWPWGKYLSKDAVNIKVSKYKRIHPETTVADAKICGNYVNSVLASLEIAGTEYDEALFLDFEGYIAEGPGENIFIVKNNKLYTPTLGYILPGITRDSVITLAKEMRYEVEEKKLTLEDLYNADEAFFCGTAVEITGIASVNDKKIGDGTLGKITQKIKETYLKEVRGEGKHKEWIYEISS